MKYKKGFTLIEILVVVSIIGIIAAVIVTNLNSAKVKAVGIKSVTELDQLKKALELYRTDNGKYPGEGVNMIYDRDGGIPFSKLFKDSSLVGNSEKVVDFFQTELIGSDSKYISAIPYYVASHEDDFNYIVGKDFLSADFFKCGGVNFSSYLILFNSNSDLPLPKRGDGIENCADSKDENGVITYYCPYCLGQ
ncbi:MAG: prepilin-type N-terminal cleavage/methylation domain-containing protein [Candidatus Paceibacterota bacterium]|jgi:prepilin-type N-terminal cleavage/methylation domain-containing protein